jgi:hypothetical protein
MAFRDLSDFLVVKPIVLPIAGKEYTFPGEGQIPARIGLEIERLNAVAMAAVGGTEYDPDEDVPSDVTQNDLEVALLGPAREEMIADGRTRAEMAIVFRTLWAWQLVGEEIALSVWNGSGEAPTPNRAARRSKTPAKSSRSRGSRAASTAPPTATPAASPGPQSSNDGT